MFKLIMNDSSTYELPTLPFESLLDRKGVTKKVLVVTFGPSVASLADVKAIVGDELKTAKMDFYEDDTLIRSEKEYTVLEQIATDTIDINGEETTVLLAKLSKATTIPAQIEELTKSLAEVKKTADKVTDVQATVTNMQSTLGVATDDIEAIEKKIADVNEDELDLAGLKEYRIKLSKVNLATYLKEHPVTSSAHQDKEGLYSITEEKQSLLMAMIMMATLNPTYQPSWNTVGEPCSYDWTLDELKALAADIEKVVRPLISKQQKMESDINKAETIEAVKAISIVF